MVRIHYAQLIMLLLPIPIPSFPPPFREAAPLIPARRSGELCISSPNVIWGGAPVEIEFDAFQP